MSCDPGHLSVALLLLPGAYGRQFPTPISLQWAERPDGEWHPIGGGELPNTGEFIGQLADVATTGETFDRAILGI